MARVLAWAPTPKLPPATGPTVATVVEGEAGMLGVAIRTEGVELQSTTPTGGINIE